VEKRERPLSEGAGTAEKAKERGGIARHQELRFFLGGGGRFMKIETI
jgi:hypothetical protein